MVQGGVAWGAIVAGTGAGPLRGPGRHPARVDGVLKIRGERQPDPAFRQDQYRDGILEIRLLKRPEATPRIISVEAA